MRHLPILILIATLPSSASAQSATGDLYRAAIEAVESEADRLIELRRDIHRQPELSGQEVRTADLIAGYLRSLGFRVQTGIAGHGVVGLLDGGEDGPIVAFRADMDAVRSGDPDPVPFRSEIPGVRHICGHDIHVAVGLGLARAAAAVREDFPGRLMLIFQPAEETATGAEAMLEAGLFEQTSPDAIFAVHTALYPVGEVATTPGGMMASRSQLTVRIHGSGEVQTTADAVRRAISALGTIPPAQAGRQADPSGILVQSGTSTNRTDEVRIWAQMMTADSRNFSELERRLSDGLGTMSTPGVKVEYDFQPGAIAGVTNDSLTTARANAAIAALAPDVTVRQVTGMVPLFSEDFGSFQRSVPGVMYFLGVGEAGMPHSPGYVADERAILTGTRAMLAALLGAGG